VIMILFKMGKILGHNSVCKGLFTYQCLCIPSLLSDGFLFCVIFTIVITYREVNLLIDPVKASNSQKQRVCTVVTHELAHQWFGNLVTMQWWDDLWLNEGFASWAENWAADNIYPEWTMWDQFTTGHLSYAMKLDSLKSSHPIQVPIHRAEEVEEVFDGISYCKGGSVVRMIFETFAEYNKNSLG